MFDERAETMSRDERSALQAARLRALVDRLLTVGGLQADRLRDAGVDVRNDLQLSDLGTLPQTTKQDLWESYPWSLLAVPVDEIVAVHGSSGTGGRPTLVGYTAGDLDLWSQMCARSLGCAGATRSSIVHNAYGYGLFTGGLGIHQGAVRLGAAVIPNSAGMTARQVRLLVDLRADILTCTPSYAVYLGEALAEAGVPPSELALRAGLFGAEPWTEGLRTKIEELLPLKALDIYGLSEVIGPGVATECLEEQHGLHVNEDHFIVEVVDPLTGAPLPDGTVGELLFTTPTKQAVPLLRYRTGDLASLDRSPCACGRTLTRMSKVVGRSDDMVVVRGVNVFPSEIERVVLADERVAPHYLVVLDRRTASSRLVVAVEQRRESSNAELSQLGADLDRALNGRLGLHADVHLVPPGQLPRTEVGKAVRRLTWEPGDPAPLPGLT